MCEGCVHFIRGHNPWPGVDNNQEQGAVFYKQTALVLNPFVGKGSKARSLHSPSSTQNQGHNTANK